MMRNLNDLLAHEVKDLYSAEKQLIKALPKMAKAASDRKLSTAFSDHLQVTKKHFERLKKVCKDLSINPGNTKCDAMAGLIKECNGMIKEKANPAVRDAGLIACAQRVEHYEISGYGTAVRFAKALNKGNVAKVLEKSLRDEKKADGHLTELAINRVNDKARKKGRK